MQNIWHDLDSARITPENFMCVIEIPEGSKAKYELDKQSGLLKLDRILYTSTHYPANYGFIPRTYAEDLDPLDVLVLCSEKIYPLTLVQCYPIGYITMLDNLQSLISAPDLINNGLLVFESLIYGEEMRHFVKDMLRDLRNIRI